MTPRTRDFARKIGPWVGLLIGLLTVLGMARAEAKSAFVLNTTYQSDRRADSLTYRADMREMRAGIDELRQACHNTGACKP